MCFGSCGEGGGSCRLSGMVRKVGEVSRGAGGLGIGVDVTWLLARRKGGHCLVSSLLEEERDSVEVHTPCWLGAALLSAHSTAGFRLFWMFSFLMVFPFCMSSTYLRKSKSS